MYFSRQWNRLRILFQFYIMRRLAGLVMDNADPRLLRYAAGGIGLLAAGAFALLQRRVGRLESAAGALARVPANLLAPARRHNRLALRSCRKAAVRLNAFGVSARCLFLT